MGTALKAVTSAIIGLMTGLSIRLLALLEVPSREETGPISENP